MKKIEFRVEYTPRKLLPISELASKMDLGISNVITTEIFSWKTDTKVDKKYRTKMKKVLRRAIENAGGKVFSIEEVKI